jgi:hypothetical protein
MGEEDEEAASKSRKEVFIEVSDKHCLDMRGFTNEEAAKILSASLAPMDGTMTEESAAAHKWVPWLCA